MDLLTKIISAVWGLQGTLKAESLTRIYSNHIIF